MTHSSLTSRHLQLSIAVSIGLLCLWGVWVASRDGLSSFFSARGAQNLSVTVTDRAVTFNPANPAVHQARAAVFAGAGNFGGAIAELKQALLLREKDYALWLELGQMNEKVGNLPEAIAAFRKAVSFAPYYAEPRWQLGNLLLRTSQRSEAFAELRRAAISDPHLQHEVINLAWHAYGEDPQAVQNAIQPETVAARLALAQSFLGHHRTTEALALLRTKDDIADDDWRGFLDQLLNTRRFAEAYELWANWREVRGESVQTGNGHITNPRFENKILRDEHGFGWRLATHLNGVSFAQDKGEPHVDSQSLRLQFNGDSDPTEAIVSQLVLVLSKTHYRLNFDARTQDIVSGGLPVVVVTDVTARDERRLVQSKPLPLGTTDWRRNFVDFITMDGTAAIRIGLQRIPCSDVPCPIFGSIWLDNFSLEKL